MSAIVDIVTNLLNWFSWFLALLAVFLGVYSAFLYITSGGDAEKARKSTKVFIFTIIGIVVAVVSFSLVSVLRSLI